MVKVGENDFMLCIKNAKLVLENGIIWDGVLILDGDRIAKYGKAGEVTIPGDAEIIDACGLYVGPGFVDIHVHGGNGHMFDAEPAEAAKHFLAHGETTVLATLYYNLGKAELEEAVQRVIDAMEQGGAADSIAGIYMEGPFMNPKYGAMPEKNRWRGEITPESYRELVDLAGETVKVWAVAPERAGIEGFVQYAASVNPNVRFGVGHSEATPAEIRRLKKYGLSIQTHCMDATGRVPRCRGTRGCGPDEACMLDPDMYAELICDSYGIHVNPSMIQLVLKNKGLDKVVLITDSFVSDRQGPAEFCRIKDLMFDDNGGLSGSRLTMEVACRNLMTHTNCGIAQAFLLASRNPARAIGLDHEIGTIEEGKKANLVFVDDTFCVKKVILGGKVWNS